ncbi:hypothetical protein [Dactylosporangium sp. NPDC051484]|uniref:hypothetical protein n=1 Tax=Dactylosporangium sp. NPDC051484 TaxID=3154942 RepID=UPI0034508923
MNRQPRQSCWVTNLSQFLAAAALVGALASWPDTAAAPDRGDPAHAALAALAAARTGRGATAPPEVWGRS